MRESSTAGAKKPAVLVCDNLLERVWKGTDHRSDEVGTRECAENWVFNRVLRNSDGDLSHVTVRGKPVTAKGAKGAKKIFAETWKIA